MYSSQIISKCGVFFNLLTKFHCNLTIKNKNKTNNERVERDNPESTKSQLFHIGAPNILCGLYVHLSQLYTLISWKLCNYEDTAVRDHSKFAGYPAKAC